jgi:glycerophosphoryl diester phosphodiesterase
MKKIVIWAHRGASGEAPENTLSAFRLAEQAGADGLELDVRLTADGVPMVLHDDTLDRTTDVQGMLSAYSRQELLNVDAGSWFAPQFTGEGVPALEQVLQWADERLYINIEIKEYAAGMAVRELLHHFPRCRVLISSFDHRLLQALRENAPEIPVGFLSETRWWHRQLCAAASCGAESFHPRQDLVTPEQIAQCHAVGLKVYPWVVDDTGRFEALLRMGVDGVFTNYPARLRRCQDNV